MKDIDFSQNVIDTIGIITTITICIAILILVVLLIYHYFNTEKVQNDLKTKKLKLEIKDLEERSQFREIQNDLMKAKTKWHKEHERGEE